LSYPSCSTAKSGRGELLEKKKEKKRKEKRKKLAAGD
jgi:hypothetical protein